jgi:hypothetical protein
MTPGSGGVWRRRTAAMELMTSLHTRSHRRLDNAALAPISGT